MGYRNYLGSIPKYERNVYTKFTTEEEIQASIDLIYPNRNYTSYCPPHHKKMFEIIIDINEVEDPMDRYQNFYSVEIDEHEFKIITKEQFYRLIQTEVGSMHLHIAGLKEKLQRVVESPSVEGHFLSKKDLHSIGEVINYLSFKESEWQGSIGIKEDSDCEITGCWSKEVALMNYMFVYKTFDWENNYLILNGY